MCDVREILTMPPESQRLTERIVEKIKQHPVLYCAEVTGFNGKITNFKQKVWERIASELGVESTWLRLKWKNLRDTYSRIVKLTLSKSDEENATRRKWYFEDHLSFLKLPFESNYVPLCVELTKEYIDEIYSTKTTPEGLLEQLEDPSEEDYSEYMEVLEEASGEQEEETIEMLESEDQLITQSSETQHEQEMLTQQDADATSYVPQKKSKFQKMRPKLTSTPYKQPKKSITKSNNDTSSINNTNTSSVFTPSKQPSKELNDDKESEMNYEQVYLTPESKNSIELFFESMAQTVKKLPPKAQADIKLNICKIVTEAEVEYANSDTAQESTQQCLKSPAVLPKMVLIPCNMLDKKDKKKQQL